MRVTSGLNIGCFGQPITKPDTPKKDILSKMCFPSNKKPEQ